MFIRRSNYNRNYKYSHPLAGKIYDNHTYASKCPSLLDKQGNSRRKLSTSGSEEPSSRVEPNRYQTLMGHHTRREVISTRKVQSAVHDSFPVQNR